MCFSCICLFILYVVVFVIFLTLLVSGLAAVCDRGTPWTFLLTFFQSPASQVRIGKTDICKCCFTLRL